MIAEFIHKTVLLKESIDNLNIQSGDIYLDGTLGSGGHSEYALKLLKGDIKVIGLDLDQEAINRAKSRLNEYKDVHLIESSYANVDKVLNDLNIKKVNRIMLDLGLSSDQFETSNRGFAFKSNEPLLMTFYKNPNSESITASKIVNEWEENNLADIIYGYGEEKFSRRIAHAIVSYREKKKIETTGELVEIITNSVPFFYRKGRIHPATRTFQALRIAVNDELNTLKIGLRKCFDCVDSGGRMSVISFHSLEDRIVKNFNKEKEESGEAKIIFKKPIVPSDEEISNNPRSRSAKLRIIEKI